MHKGDWGFELRLDTEQEFPDYSEARIFYQKPSGTTGYWEATLEGTEVVYTTKEGDIDEAGVWILQAYVRGQQYELYGKKVSLLVEEKLS